LSRFSSVHVVIVTTSRAACQFCGYRQECARNAPLLVLRPREGRGLSTGGHVRMQFPKWYRPG
jgi:hypothetical protein